MKTEILSLRKWLFILLLVSRKGKLYASITCPKLLQVEEGSDATVKCNITVSNVSAIYWYKGTIPRSFPILQLNNSEPGGVEYGKGHFDITNEGAMVIKGVTMDDEGFYNIFVAKGKLQFLADEIEIKIKGDGNTSSFFIRLLVPEAFAGLVFILTLRGIFMYTNGSTSKRKGSMCKEQLASKNPKKEYSSDEDDEEEESKKSNKEGGFIRPKTKGVSDEEDGEEDLKKETKNTKQKSETSELFSCDEEECESSPADTKNGGRKKTPTRKRSSKTKTQTTQVKNQKQAGKNDTS